MVYGWLDILMCLWILARLETARPPATLERQNSNHRKKATLSGSGKGLSEL